MITVLVPPHMERPARDWLRKHGCRIFNKDTYYKIMFPEGTSEAELFPRCVEPRFKMCLPDGTRIYRQEMRGRERGSEGLNVLFLPIKQEEDDDELTEERERYYESLAGDAAGGDGAQRRD
ncbi:MAG: hypothetical protein IMW89_04745 [Ktedonobacteraceae bacterium]|nr:hypothetical protein [Ktedonobacteraceae bacterium]